MVGEGLRRAMLRANAARSMPDRLKAFLTVRPHDLAPVPPAVVEPRTGLSMGESQALTTARWGITRAAQDEVAARVGANNAQVAIAWLMAQPTVTAPIVSATDRAQVDDLAAAARLQLDDEALAALDRASAP